MHRLGASTRARGGQAWAKPDLDTLLDGLGQALEVLLGEARVHALDVVQPLRDHLLERRVAHHGV